MITDESNFYSILPFEMEGNRLDFVYHHPNLEFIRGFRRSCNLKLGSLVTEPDYGMTESGLPDGAIGFLNVQHIHPTGEIVFDPPVYINDYQEENLLKEGDILIARTGHTLGKTAFITSEFEGYAFGSFCIRFSLRPKVEFSEKFIVLFLNSTFGQMQILMLKTGSGKYNINTDQIKDIRIPEIRFPRQREIVDMVSPLELEAKELAVKATAIRAFADTLTLKELGLSIFPTTPINYFFKTGAEKRTIWFSIFPEEATERQHYLFFHPNYKILDTFRGQYRTVSLAEICATPIVRGQQPDYEEFGTVTVLKTVDLKNGYIDYENALKVSEDFYNLSPASHVKKSDILIASTGYVSMGKVDVYDREDPAMIDGHISIIRVNEDYDPFFVASFLRSHLGQLQFERWFTGSSGQIELQPGDLGRFIIPFSGNGGIPLQDQKRIAEIIHEQLNMARDLECKMQAKWEEAKKTFEEMIFKS